MSFITIATNLSHLSYQVLLALLCHREKKLIYALRNRRI